MSVPYSGTRSLMAHLELDHYEHFVPNRTSLLHAPFYGHIPIRHPMDVAASWASRRLLPGALERLVGGYHLMLEFVQHCEHELHRIEDLAIVIGQGERSPGDHGERVDRFQGAVLADVVWPNRDLFGRFYPELRGA